MHSLIHALHSVIITSFMRCIYSLFMHATYSQLTRPTHLSFMRASSLLRIHLSFMYRIYTSRSFTFHASDYLGVTLTPHSCVTHFSIMRYTRYPIIRCTHSLFMFQPYSLESLRFSFLLDRVLRYDQDEHASRCTYCPLFAHSVAL